MNKCNVTCIEKLCEIYKLLVFTVRISVPKKIIALINEF